MDYLIDLKKQDLSGKTALEGGISLGVDANGDLKKIDETGEISDIGGSVDESRLLPETGSVSSDSVGNPVIFKAISRIDNTYWLCLPLNEDTNDRSTCDVATGVYGTVNIVSNAPSSPGGSAFFNGSSCLHGTLPAQFGASDFTVRLWMMAPAMSGSSSQTIFSTRYGDQTDESTFALLCTTEGRLFIYSNGNITSRTDTPFTLQPSVWYHVAVVRKSGVLTIYVNGEVYNSATFTNSLTRQIFGLGASWTGSSYSEAGTVYLTSLDVLNYAAYDGAFTTPAYQPGTLSGMGYEVATDSEVTNMLSSAGIDESRLIPTGGKDGDILGYQEGADRGNGADVRLLLQNAMTDSANGNAAPAAVTTQGVTLTGDNNLLFSGNDSHVTAVLATDEIFAADKEWTIDFWMKPTANSSEWNYILTENRGDWGSHSIGLTWNKSKSVLEQDTGGYVASVIKAPNWPNNSIACAANEWHFIAVEKQKTATGWSLNYYLNGAIWLQVAFTGEFVPFTSDNPFWFGGKTTDSGRWFKGEVNKLRVTMGARYGGKAFAVPDRLTDYAAPAGQPVWVDGIDRSRLLPENPANGDIPCFDATVTVGGGNDANTKALIHFDTEVKDEAAGNASPAAVTNSGITLDTENFRFGTASARFADGSNNLKVAVPQAQMMASPWLADCWFKVDDGQWNEYCRIFTQDDEQNGGWNYYLMSGNRVGVCVRNVTPNEPASAALTPGDWHYAALVYYNAKFYGFIDGVRFTVQDGSSEGFLNYIMLGKRIQSTSYSLRGNIDEFRLQLLDKVEIGKWTGLTIPVPVEAYSVAQTVGKWGKLNKNELVQSVNGITPDENGNVNIDSELTLDQLKYNDVPYKYQGMTIDSSLEDPIMTSRFYGKAVSTFGDLDSTATFPSFPFKPYLRDDRLVGGEAAIYYELWKSDSTNTDEWNTIEFKSVNAPSKIIKISAQTAGTDACVMRYTLDGLRKDGAILARIVQGKMTLSASSASNVLGDFSELNFNTNEIAKQYFDSFELKVRTEGASGDKAASGIASIKFMITEKNAAWVGINKKNLVRSINGYKPLDGAVTLPEATTSAAGLMSATDRRKSIGLTTRGFYPNALAKSGAVDFNEVIDHGFYFIGGDTPHLNYPETYQQNGGTLQVIRSGDYLTQTFIPLNIKKTFVRSCLNALSDSSERTFSAWRRPLTDTDITESKARPGYFKLPGGTIVQWGAASNITADGSTQITFPVAFPNAFLIGNATAVSGNASASGVVVSLTSVTVTGMTLIIKNHPRNSNDINVHWLAIGY